MSCTVHAPQENDAKMVYLRIDGQVCLLSVPMVGVDPCCDLHLSTKSQNETYLVRGFCTRNDYFITCDKHPNKPCFAKKALLNHKERNFLLEQYATTVPYKIYDQNLSIAKQLMAHPQLKGQTLSDFLCKMERYIFVLVHYNKPIENIMMNACVGQMLKDFVDYANYPYVGPQKEEPQWKETMFLKSCADFLALKMKEHDLLYFKQIQFASHLLHLIEQAAKQQICFVEDCECNM